MAVEQEFLSKINTILEECRSFLGVSSYDFYVNHTTKFLELLEIRKLLLEMIEGQKNE